NGSAESVDTLDYEPPPVLPPRRPPWPSNSPSSTASRYIGQRITTATTIATTSPLTPTAATTTTTSTTPLTTTLVPATSASQGSTTFSSARVSPQPPPLTPPQYPAPPRPPSRNGGDEARVARARGSGRGALPSLILANGTPLSRVPPPRAGWAVRINEATLTTPNQSAPNQQQQHQHHHHQRNHHTSSSSTPRTVEQWASERASSSALSVGRSASPSSPEAAATGRSGTGSPRRVLSSSSRVRPGGGGGGERGEGEEGGGGGGGGRGRGRGEGGAEVTGGVHFANHWQEEEELEAKKKEEHRKRRVDATAHCQTEHLELRGRPMSQNNAIAPLSRPPSSQTNANNLDNNATDAADDGDAVSVLQQQQQQQQNATGRVHDHNRPFPPPRLPTVHVATATTTAIATATATVTATATATATASTALLTASNPNPRVLVTAPLSPLSSTFRSRPRNVDTSNETNARGLLSSNDTPPRSPIGEVSLTVPRPDGERAINEYVEAPFKHCNQERRLEDGSKRGGIVGADCPKIDRRHRQKGAADASVAATHRLHAIRTQGFRGLNASGTNAAASAGAIPANVAQSNAVTKQPVSFTKEPANSPASRTYDPAGLSIMCNFCGRCRCESCREPPPLPSKWLCDNKCFCSADAILDYASCLCCVKGLFYHCADGSSAAGIDAEAARGCADEPCSCTGNRRATRWACLGALTLVMPCLLCYWPFKGCVALCEMCYARHAAQGCRCNPNTIGNAGNRHHPIANDIGDSRDPEKRLLDPVTPEL
ncbi:sprouty signaling antagonist, partial [Xylocopa sonorina]|uniref:sprouty signaling antagonist n=1 Tax=Xylocopa sonorina TaxID=1818115 RepID=UPI00403ACC8A